MVATTKTVGEMRKRPAHETDGVAQDDQPLCIEDDGLFVEPRTVDRSNHLVGAKTKAECKKTRLASRKTKPPYLTDDVAFLETSTLRKRTKGAERTTKPLGSTTHTLLLDADVAHRWSTSVVLPAIDRHF